MQDIAALGFAIDSSKALEAAQNLDRMATASARAEAAVAEQAKSIEAMRLRIEQLVKVQQQQAAVIASLTSQLKEQTRAIQDQSSAVQQSVGIMEASFRGLLNVIQSTYEFITKVDTGRYLTRITDDIRKAGLELRNLSLEIGASPAQTHGFLIGTSGLGLSQAATQNILSRIEAAKFDTGTVGKAQRAAFAELGISVGPNDDDLEVYRRINDELNKLADGYQKNALYVRLWGSANAEYQQAALVNARALNEEEKKAIEIRQERLKRDREYLQQQILIEQNDESAIQRRKREAAAALSDEFVELMREEESRAQKAVRDAMSKLDFSKLASETSHSMKASTALFLEQTGLINLFSDPDEIRKSLGFSVTPDERQQIDLSKTFAAYKETYDKIREDKQTFLTRSAQQDAEFWENALKEAMENGPLLAQEWDKFNAQVLEANRRALIEEKQIFEQRNTLRRALVSDNAGERADLEKMIAGEMSARPDLFRPSEVEAQRYRVLLSNRAAFSARRRTELAVDEALAIGRRDVFQVEQGARARQADFDVRVGRMSLRARTGMDLADAERDFSFSLDAANRLREQAISSDDPNRYNILMAQAHAMEQAARAKLEADKKWIAGTIERVDAERKATDEETDFINRRMKAYADSIPEARSLARKLAEAEFEIRREEGIGPDQPLTGVAAQRYQARASAIGRAAFNEAALSRSAGNGDLARQNAEAEKILAASRRGARAESEAMIQIEVERARLQLESIARGKEEMKQVDDLVSRYEKLLRRSKDLAEAQQAAHEIRSLDRENELLDYQLSILDKSSSERQRLLDLKSKELELNDRLHLSEKDRQAILEKEERAGRKRQQVQDAEREQQIQEQIARNALENIQSDFANFFYQINKGGTNTWKELFDSLKDTAARTFAELQSAILVRPVLGSVLGGLGLDDDELRSLGLPGVGTSSKILGGLGRLFGLEEGNPITEGKVVPDQVLFGKPLEEAAGSLTEAASDLSFEAAKGLKSAADALGGIPNIFSRLIGQQITGVVNLQAGVVNLAGGVGGGGILNFLDGALDVAQGGYAALLGGSAGTSSALAASGTSFADMLAGGMIAMAKGGAFNRGVRFLASGGILDRPTLFTDAGGRLNVGGEAGTEAVMPLFRGPDGNLGVRLHGTPRQGNQMIVNIDARNATPGTEIRIRRAIREAADLAKAEMREEISAGGTMAVVTGRRKR